MADEIVGFPKLKVDDLKRELQKRGLPVKGTKAELQNRLLEYLKKDVALDSDTNTDKKDPQDEIEDNNDLEHSAEEDNEDDNEEDNEDDNEEDNEEDIDISTGQELDDVIDVKLEDTDIKEDDQSSGNNDAKLPKTKQVTIRKSIPVTEEEKRMARGKRFGEVSNEVDKKKLRAERFKTGGSAEDVVFKGKPIADLVLRERLLQGDELEKIKKRADRFGVISPVMDKLGENERREKRQQRFGIVTSVSTKPTSKNLDDRKRKRMERFGKA